MVNSSPIKKGNYRRWMRIFVWQLSYMACIESLKHIKIEIAKSFSVWNQNFKDIWWLKYNRQWPRMTMSKMTYQGSVWDIGFWSNISTTMRHWILVKYLIKSTTMIYLDLGQISHQIYIYEKLDSNQISHQVFNWALPDIRCRVKFDKINIFC